jgi:hypothetical protein
MPPLHHTLAILTREACAPVNLATNFLMGSGFRPDDAHRMMRELWTEYVVGNPQLFPPKTE